VACALLCALLGGDARAEPPSSARVPEGALERTLLLSADGCPSAAQVRDMLVPLVAGTRVLIAPEHAGEAPSEEARVRDLGGDYAIELRGAQRQHHDAAADCVERARVAAVFIALNLPGRTGAGVDAGPARAGGTGSSAESAQEHGAAPGSATVEGSGQSATRAARASVPSARRPFRIGVSALALLAFAPELQGVAPGGSAGLWLRRGLVKLELSGGVTAESELPVSPAAPGGSAAMWRFPLVASAGVLWRTSRFELGPSLGLALDLLSARAQDVARSERALRANAGVQLAAAGQLLLTERLALLLSLSGSLFPRSYELRIEPEGRHADTPRVWLSAQFGLACIVW
jgi:hypothetical protein